ncbi:2-(S)-hydroxypropyl-CoM dehydrogenase [Streptomyces cyanogenus]|uniref:2-(S)-hydroxypropyl-CoM dehydrogenase n=1 Tax=Streptomyces cyanogenus TaxID=80860 RepID=A0ABX7U2I6_STRCY|nr:2-(S)-hydroxypropyl-CoM dehydrogenase [Streptomyces cyanogenus]
MSVATVPGRAWLTEQDCDLGAFRAVVERTTDPAGYPHTPELFAVDLKGPFFAMGGGRYVAAKAALVGLTLAHARTELARGDPIAAHAHRWDRIRINGLDIGWTATEGEDVTQRSFHGAGHDWREQAAARPPMGRLGRPDEIADFVVFLLSERSGVVTGSVIDWDQNVLEGGLD